MESPVTLAVEGITDEVVMKRVLEYVGLPLGNVYGREGKESLRKQMRAYRNAARYAPWCVVVDLDQEKACAPALIKDWLPETDGSLCFRVAVHAIESWLLADREQLAPFLGIPVERIPSSPEMEIDPKQTLINLARHSRLRSMREDILPRPQSGRRVGEGYTSRIIEFASLHWRPQVAQANADSLQRCIACLRQFKSRNASG